MERAPYLFGAFWVAAVVGSFSLGASGELGELDSTNAVALATLPAPIVREPEGPPPMPAIETALPAIRKVEPAAGPATATLSSPIIPASAGAAAPIPK
jgi:hypothetical protein